MDKNVTKVKFYIAADSKDGLIRKCLKNNQINDKMFDYKYHNYDPVDKVWVAWFDADAATYKRVR